MKNVLKNSNEVFHYWANQVQDYGRNGGDTVSFRGACLFSYREPIALYVGGGTSTCVFSSRNWSVTTSHHQGQAHRACRAVTYVFVPFLAETEARMLGQHDKNLDYFQRQFVQYTGYLTEKRRKRSYDKNLNTIQSVIESYNTYRRIFNLDWPDLVNADELRAMWAERAAAIERERQIAEEKAIAEEQEALGKWRSGEDVRRWFHTTGLRLKDGLVQTTQGAEIPVEHAKRVWPLLCRVKRSGKVFSPEGRSVHLGVYTLDFFDGELLIAGCHRIPWTEISHIAAMLELPPYNQGDNDGRACDGASDGDGRSDCDGGHHAREGDSGNAGEAAAPHGG